MTEPKRWKPVEPPLDSAPTEEAIATRARFEALAASAPAGIQKSAEKWSSGLIALIGVITGGMLLKGPAATADIGEPWRWCLIGLTLLAVGTAVYALWRLLAVTARTYRITSRADLLDHPGAYEHHRVQAAAKDAATINHAIHFGAAALAMQVLAIALWWVTPAQPAQPPALVSVLHDKETSCGELVSADKGELRIKVPGERDPRSIPLSDMSNMKIVGHC